MPALTYVYRAELSNTEKRKKVRESTFNKFWTRIFEVCSRHGPTGPDREQPDPSYYVVDQRYAHQCVVIEILKADALAIAWIEDLRSTLGEFSDASVILTNVGEGSAELFQDAFVASGKGYAQCHDLSQWLAQSCRFLSIAAALKRVSDDASLASLQQIPELKTQEFRLSLREKPITDAGLAAIQGLGGLVDIDLSDTSITDHGLESLAGMTRMKYLRLSGTRVTDEGLRWLSEMRQLEFLSLDRTAITGAGLAWLNCRGTLTELDLDRSRFSDQHAPILTRFTLLDTLRLEGTGVTDAIFEHLEKLERLYCMLELDETKVSPQGLIRAKQLLSRNLDLSTARGGS